jgi:hypothetical protein
MVKKFITRWLLIPTILVGFLAIRLLASDSLWLKGYEKTLRSEKILYHSPYPGKHSALLVRAADGTMVSEWETEKAPENFKEKEALFVFMGGLATAKGSHRFYLTVEDKSTIVFNTSADSSRKKWTVSNEDGISLSFDTAMVDQFNELFGYFFLKVPARMLVTGKALKLRLSAEKGGSPDWVMVFEHRLSSWAKLRALPSLLNTRPPHQLLLLEISHFGEPDEVQIQLGKNKSFRKRLQFGYNQLYLQVPQVKTPVRIEALIFRRAEKLYSLTTWQKPVKSLELWLLPHSHVDIGYSDYQPVVEKKHWENFEKALELAGQSLKFPKEARFKWNVEQLWAVETYLNQVDTQKKQKFFEAIKKGWIGLQVTLANELTGLCHPEELFELTAFSRKLEAQGIPPITSAMITDIPSYSWSFVPSLALGGVKYLSSGPNYMPTLPDSGDRIGWALKTWGDRPFYWVSPSGHEKILFWMAGRGYSWFHGLNLGNLSTEKKREILEYVEELNNKNYPYSLVQVRYTVGGDNGPTDPDLSQAVKVWNEEFLSPRLVIATSQELFEELEKRHGQEIPELGGDFSPYWEDGAASTAKETALNRNLSDRLIQLETLYSLLLPGEFPAEDFYQAWRNVVLFHEHTWGAADSISSPDGENAVKQWEYKKGFLNRAESLTSSIFDNLKKRYSGEKDTSHPDSVALDIFNTNSWEREEIVYIPAELSSGKDLAVDEKNQLLNSQRLSDGALSVELTGIQPFSCRRIRLKTGIAPSKGTARAGQDFLENDFLKLKIDSKTGAISSLVFKNGKELELVDTKKFSGLNAYLYVPGTDPQQAQPARLLKASVLDSGPAVASLALEFEAPGCHKLQTIIRINNLNSRIDFINQLDKKKVREKESVHFAFPFNLAGAEVKLDVGWGLANPFFEEIHGSCKDFFSIQKAVYLIRPDLSLTWVSPDVPLVEIGELTDEKRIDGHPRVWKKELQPSTSLISYALNNYWHTNYKADQEGEIVLRYSLILQPGFDQSQAKRKSLEVCQPPVILASGKRPEPLSSKLQVKPEKVIPTRLKPSADGQGMIIRLFNSSGKTEEINLSGALLVDKEIHLSNLKEEKLNRVVLPLKISPGCIVTLRLD